MLIAIVASLGVQAAPPPSPPSQNASPEIVVQGQRDTERRIGEFVRVMTNEPVTGQIGRFDWSVCPTVTGLSGRQNSEAAERMRAVAGAAGMRVATPGCRANVLVVVTDDSSKLVAQLRNRQPAFFDGVSPKEMAMIGRGGPAEAWHIEGRLDADGREVPYDTRTGQYINERTDVPSRLSTDSRPHFKGAVVILDSRALGGLTVAQLADYAAMRAFARTDPSLVARASAPSILTILDAPPGSAVPITLTQWDMAYLKSLYASRENRLAGQQRQEMEHKMADELRPSPDRN
jgi:hypothetical protein